MKLSLVSVILSAGLAISQVSAAPLRVVWVSKKVTTSTTSNPIAFVRVGHAAAQPASSFVATMHVDTSMQAAKPWTKPRVACAGSLRNKAFEVKEWLKHAFGIAPPPHTKPSMHGDAGRYLTPSGHVKETSMRPAGAFVHHSHHHKHPYERRPQFFGQRLSRALMILGPWEGRILAFVIGCGIGVLIRMFWVFAVLLIRSARGPRREEEFLADEVIFEEQEHLLPPQYSESNTPAEEGKEKN